MNYLLTRGVDDLDMPVVGAHAAVELRVFVAVSVAHRWVEVVCTCGRAFRHHWAPETTNYRGLAYLAWLGGCGRAAYLPFSLAASTRPRWPEGPEPQFEPRP